ADNVPGQTSGPPEGRFDIGWLLPDILPLHSNACRFQNTLASSHLDRGNSRPAGQRQPSQAIRELATGVFSCGYFSPRMPVERFPKLLLSISHASGSLPVRLFCLARNLNKIRKLAPILCAWMSELGKLLK